VRGRKDNDSTCVQFHRFQHRKRRSKARPELQQGDVSCILDAEGFPFCCTAYDNSFHMFSTRLLDVIMSLQTGPSGSLDQCWPSLHCLARWCSHWPIAHSCQKVSVLRDQILKSLTGYLQVGNKQVHSTGQSEPWAHKTRGSRIVYNPQVAWCYLPE
jgi:hypothetical protein